MSVAENNQIHVTCSMVYAKASKFAERLGIDSFKGSNGWMHWFAKHNGLKLHRLHEKSGSCNGSVIACNKDKFQHSVYSRDMLKQTFSNCDFTHLFQKRRTKNLSVWVFFAMQMGAKSGSHWSLAWRTNQLLKVEQKQTDHGFRFYFHNSNAWMTRRIFRFFLGPL